MKKSELIYKHPKKSIKISKIQKRSINKKNIILDCIMALKYGQDTFVTHKEVGWTIKNNQRYWAVGTRNPTGFFNNFICYVKRIRLDKIKKMNEEYIIEIKYGFVINVYEMKYLCDVKDLEKYEEVCVSDLFDDPKYLPFLKYCLVNFLKKYEQFCIVIEPIIMSPEMEFKEPYDERLKYMLFKVPDGDFLCKKRITINELFKLSTDEFVNKLLAL